MDEEVQALLRLVFTELFEGNKFQLGHCFGSLRKKIVLFDAGTVSENQFKGV